MPRRGRFSCHGRPESHLSYQDEVRGESTCIWLDPRQCGCYFHVMEKRMTAFIPKTWDLPESIRRRLGDQAGRQRLMDEDGHLLLILHSPPRPEDDALRNSAVFWCNPAGEWKSAPASGGLSALQGHLASFRTCVQQLDEIVDAANEPRQYFEVMRAINPLLRSSRNLLGVMEQARKARPDERRLILLRDEAVEVERGAELLANDADSVKRLPYFCSGCPHNTSTRVPEGSRALAGIGCHYMAMWMDRSTETFTQMGGEGVSWLGQMHFSGDKHVFANLGDGTYFHSGMLAIRAAIAAGANITYKILFNDAVAMTGGQPVDGTLTVPQIACQVAAEGAGRILIVTDEPEKYSENLDN